MNVCIVEFYINMHERRSALEKGRSYKNPFDKGWRKNLTRVFGSDGKIMLTHMYVYVFLLLPLRTYTRSYGFVLPVLEAADSDKSCTTTTRISSNHQEKG